MTDKLTSGLPARVILETTIVQEGEVFKHSFDEMGRIVQLNGNYYIRYTESKAKKDTDEIATLIKIDADGVVSLTRHGENKTRLVFDNDEETLTTYPTPQGILQLMVKTDRLSISTTQQPFAGEVEVDYAIHMEGAPLGTYQIRLIFTT